MRLESTFGGGNLKALRKSPSFKGLRPSSPASSLAKRANRKTNTKAELELQEALRRHRMWFDVHRSDLQGCPDFVFPQYRVVVFCDGDFWHGRNWKQLAGRLARRANASYWIAKIGANRARDVRIRRALRRRGWTVIRVWETDILQDSRAIASSLRRTLHALRTSAKGSRKSGQAALTRTGTAERKMPSSR